MGNKYIDLLRDVDVTVGRRTDDGPDGRMTDDDHETDDGTGRTDRERTDDVGTEGRTDRERPRRRRDGHGGKDGQRTGDDAGTDDRTEARRTGRTDGQFDDDGGDVTGTIGRTLCIY